MGIARQVLSVHKGSSAGSLYAPEMKFAARRPIRFKFRAILERGHLGFLLVLLAGCARYHPQPLSPAQTAERFENRSLTNAALRTFLETNLHREITPWPAATWDFDMLTLAALYYHPSLEVARAQWAVAQGGEVTAGQRPNPTLTVTPGYDTTTTIPSPWIPLTFIDIPIETAGKRRFRRAQAASLSAAARRNISSVAWQVRSNLRTGLLDLAISRQRAALLEKQFSVQQAVGNAIDQQVQAGALSSAEALPYRIALQKTRLDLADAERMRIEARGRLAEAIGVPVQSLDAIQLDYDWHPPADIARELVSTGARRTALQSRPDILGALAEYAATEAALQLEIAKQYPDVRLQPGYQYDQGDNKWSLGIVVDLPILNQNQGAIAEAQARRRESAARFDALQAKVLAEIDLAVEELRVTENNASNFQVLAAEQIRRRDSVNAEFQAGAVSRLDLLNAQLEVASADLLQLEGQVKLQQALGALEDAVQRPIFGGAAAAALSDSRLIESPMKENR
jgi:outer membrane protein TolC